MTQVTMNWEELSLRAEGHAGAGEQGEDIVCAGISVLTQTLLNTLMDAKARGRTTLKYRIDEEKGLLELEASPNEFSRNEVWSYFRMTMIGLKAIAQNYKGYLKIREVGK